MNKKKLYRQKYHAEVDALKADIEKMQAEALVAGANVKIELAAKVKDRENQVHMLEMKLSNMSFSFVRAWRGFKRGAGAVCRIFTSTEVKSK